MVSAKSNDGLKVFLVCSGLGNVNRGYESFTRECFDVLSKEGSFNLFLLKGGGEKAEHELVIKNLKRTGKTTKFLSRLAKREPYYIEQLSFLVGMIPSIIKHRPSVIYFSDFILGTFLWQLRNFFKFKYKLLFSNGAPNGPPFSRTDHVQQLLPFYVEEALAAGTPSSMQSLVPYGIKFSKEIHLEKLSRQLEIRKELGLPTEKRIIISVGAVNSFHKRMDYVLSEFSKLNPEDYFLIILGQIDDASNLIIDKARETLRTNSYMIKQVSANAVTDYLFASDYFILASTKEGLPRVLPEALSTGLLPIVHDYCVTRQTLNKYGVFKNLMEEGQLANAISTVEEMKITKEELVEHAFNFYSWESVKGEYINMIKKVF